MTTTETCPAPLDHDRWYRANETTWRKTPEQRASDRANGQCPYCPRPLPKEEPSGTR